MNKTWNAYTARFFITTAKRAHIDAQKTSSPHYGYVVRCDPPAPGHSSQVYAWCKTKAIAERTLASYENSKAKGYWACPCGSDKQAAMCCGIPEAR